MLDLNVFPVLDLSMKKERQDLNNSYQRSCHSRHESTDSSEHQFDSSNSNEQRMDFDYSCENGLDLTYGDGKQAGGGTFKKNLLKRYRKSTFISLLVYV